MAVMLCAPDNVQNNSLAYIASWAAGRPFKQGARR